MKKTWDDWILQGTNKYLNDLFYVGPLYHQIFINLEKLIFLDVGNHWASFQTIFKSSNSDLEFYRDVKLLYKQFAQFDSSQLIGVRRIPFVIWTLSSLSLSLNNCTATIALQQLHFTCVAYLWYICSTNNDRNACQSTSTSLLHATTIFYLKVGLDLSPHYRTSLELYRKQNPGTHIGQPGRWTRKILFNIVFVFVVVHILAFLQL